MTARMGWREGSVIPAAAGCQAAPGALSTCAAGGSKTISAKGRVPFGDGFQGGIITGQTQNSLNQRFGAIAQAEGKQIHVGCGELAFRCGAPRIRVCHHPASLAARRSGLDLGDLSHRRFSDHAAESGAAAATAMHTMLETFELNQQWLQNFARECNDVAGNVIRESNAITQSTIERCKQMDEEPSKTVRELEEELRCQLQSFEGE